MTRNSIRPAWPRLLLALLFCWGSAVAQEANRTVNPHDGIDVPCQNCHATTSWSPIRAVPEFNHNTETAYPLRGLHTDVRCTDCHRSLAFSNVGVQCADCHADIHSNQFGARCQDCHSVQGWGQAIQEISDHRNRFPLVGAHAAVQCASCHPGAATGVYTGLSTECVTCHQADYAGARSLDHAAAGLSLQCETCHSVDQWDNASFDHNALTNFALTGAHAQVDCTQCHVGGQFQGVSTECFSCHAREFNGTTSPDHAQAGFPRTCETCHSTSDWAGASFDHATQTSFALTGSHAAVDCQQCHVNGQFAGTSQQCFACHSTEYEQVTNPNHASDVFSTQCQDCHTTVQWAGAQFDHNLAAFPLTGSHTTVDCQQCHVGGQFTGTAQACVGCHLTDFNGTTDPEHEAAGFPTTCESCHNTAQWSGAVFDHNTTTNFPLTGRHVSVDCQQCHVNGQFAGTTQDCVGCHLTEFNETSDPDHAAAGFPTTCESCHNTAQWDGAVFDHNTTTAFPLTGRHVSVDCQQCHVGGQFAGTTQECVGCHLADFNGTTDPDHATAGFSTSCQVCHSTSQWEGASFSHDQTSFPLTGRHTTVDCAQCHVNGQFAGTSQACVGCHLTEFNETSDPDHAAAGFPTTCESCHNTAQWGGAVFDHNTTTAFPLTGRHVSVDCQQCHVNGQFAGTTQACAGCHLTDFNETDDPDHAAAGFPTTCESCHNTAQWDGAVFNHNVATNFPLTGSHVSVDCQQCHVNGQFAGTSQTCVGCHLTDFNETSDPDHAAAGFPTTCESCHNTVQWDGAVFDHNSTTAFPLTGRHVSVDCAQCHVGGQFAGTPQACVGCHLTDFNDTDDPDHAAAGFPTTCQSCHNTAQWEGAVFDHNTTTAFPLTGSHVSVDCQQCHVGGQFAGTPQACVGCHLTDFNETSDPDHAAAGFPTTCESCHNTVQWDGAVFNHNTATDFPLTGSHVSVDCQQCHVNGQFAGTPQACVGCHLTDFNETNDPDHAAAGFPTTCESCHNTAQWEGAVFNHTTATSFPLTGSHVSVDCQQCHVNGQFAGTPQDCVGCHLTDFNETSQPDHAAAGFPQDCALCHSTSQWLGAVFNHSQTEFPLTGAHVQQDCQTCHVNGQFQGLPTACASCHQSDYDGTNDPDHAAAGFPAQCEVCHSTSQWDGAVFDHSQTDFPLTGAHRTEPSCVDCHIGGRFQGTPTDCYSCHRTEYESVANPNHAAAGFPTSCESCHNTNQWDGARFDHAFPIYSGAHKQETWQTCSACHPNSSNFASFMCLNCHEHRQSEVDSEHQGVRGYVYNSINCLNCHPNGND